MVYAEHVYLYELFTNTDIVELDARHAKTRRTMISLFVRNRASRPVGSNYPLIYR